MVAKLCMSYIFSNAAVCGAKQLGYHSPGVLEGSLGAPTLIAPVAMRGRVKNDYQVNVMDRIKLRPSRQRTRRNNLGDVVQSIESATEDITSPSCLPNVTRLGVDNFLKTIESGVWAHWLPHYGCT